MRKLIFILLLFSCKQDKHIYQPNEYGVNSNDSITDERAAIIRCFQAAQADTNAVIHFDSVICIYTDSIIVPTNLARIEK